MNKRTTQAAVAIALVSFILVPELSGCAAVKPPIPRVDTAKQTEPPASKAPTSQTPVANPTPAPAPTPQRPAWVTPITDANFQDVVNKYHPNELGKVLVLEYHDFKDTDERWARSWSSFRKDLETLYSKGYRAVNLSDYLNNTMPLPAGTSPVLFTFDDSFANQMKLVKGADGQWQPDPKSAVGIMLQFKQEHPDFGAAGTFYCNFTPVPFREPDNWKEKIQFLVDNGFEIGNHTQYHEDLSTLTDEQTQKTFANQVKLMQQVLPKYDGDTLALPFGIWPKNHQLAYHGQYDGTTYNHKAVLLVGADPNYAPLDKRLDLMALTRVQAIDSEFQRWYPYLDKYRYISDGDPDTVTIPEDMQSYLTPKTSALDGKKLRMYKREG